MTATAKWKLLARHRNNWVQRATISESVFDDEDATTPSIRRFTATIDGFHGWKLYEGSPFNGVVGKVKYRAEAILARMDRKDDAVFFEKDAAVRSEIIYGIYMSIQKMTLPTFTTRSKNKHLIGVVNGRGFYLVSNPDMRLDREAFREIIAEARQFGLDDKKLMIYGRTCSYSGPGIDFLQLEGGGDT